MYAVVKTGGKQYRVSEGETLRVERLDAVDGKVSFDQVLLVGNGEEVKIGAPLVGAKVEAEVLRESRAKKVIIFKKKRRKGYHKKQGHRQTFTEVKVTSISA